MAATAAGIRAGKAFVEIGTQDSGLAKGLRAAQAKVTQFGSAISEMGTTLSAAGAAMLAPIGLAVKQFIDFGSQLDDTAKKTGFTVETLSELKFAGDQSGSSLEDIEKAAKKMASTLVDAKNGSDSASDSLAQLGLSAGLLLQLSPEDQFLTIADALSQVEDATLKASLAQDIFGRAGTNLLPMLAEGSEGLKSLREEARKVGATMSKEDAAAAETLGDALGSLTAAAGSAFRQIGAELAPLLKDLATTFTEILPQVKEFIRDNGEMVVRLAKVATGLLAVGAAMKAMGATISFVTKINPWILLAAAIADVAAEIATARDNTKSWADILADKFGQWFGRPIGMNTGLSGEESQQYIDETNRIFDEEEKALAKIIDSLNAQEFDDLSAALNASIDGFDLHTEEMIANLESAKKLRAAMDAEEQQRLYAMEQEARLYDIERAGWEAHIDQLQEMIEQAQSDAAAGSRRAGAAVLGSDEFARAMAEAMTDAQDPQTDVLHKQLDAAKQQLRALDTIVEQNKNAPRLAPAGL